MKSSSELMPSPRFVPSAQFKTSSNGTTNSSNNQYHSGNDNNSKGNNNNHNNHNNNNHSKIYWPPPKHLSDPPATMNRSFSTTEFDMKSNQRLSSTPVVNSFQHSPITDPRGSIGSVDDFLEEPPLLTPMSSLQSPNASPFVNQFREDEMLMMGTISSTGSLIEQNKKRRRPSQLGMVDTSLSRRMSGSNDQILTAPPFAMNLDLTFRSPINSPTSPYFTTTTSTTTNSSITSITANSELKRTISSAAIQPGNPPDQFELINPNSNISNNEFIQDLFQQNNVQQQQQQELSTTLLFDDILDYVVS